MESDIKMYLHNESYLDEILTDSTKKIVVIDLDDTIVTNHAWNAVKLFLNKGYKDVPLFEGAADSIQKIRACFHVVFISARKVKFIKGTQALLEENDLGDIPVIFSQKYLPRAKQQREYKIAVINYLKAHGAEITAGVGDKASDYVAYVSNNVESIHLIFKSEDDKDIKKVLEREEEFPKPEDTEVHHYYEQQACWEKIADALLKHASSL